jgi:SAM-dependent methyltransferase
MNRRERAQQRVEDRIYRLAVGGPPDTKWQRLVSFLTEQGYATGALRKRLGLSTLPLNTADRRVLEADIFPYYCSDPKFKRVLFVGCAVFTSHYQQKFFSDKEFWTIEPDADQAQFGSTQHVIATLEEAPKHFAAGYFDVIFCNGVYGWGINTLAQGEEAFTACNTLLRAGGHLVFGWNDIPERTPFALDNITSRNWFARFDFPPLASSRHLTATRHRHVFDFYQKPLRGQL